MNDNNSQQQREQKAAVNYASATAHQAASQNYLESRPNPVNERVAYEAWYYNLTPQQQQAEWDIYYQKEKANNPEVEVQEQPQHHAVSTDYAHEHITPQPHPDNHTPTLEQQIIDDAQAVHDRKPAEVHGQNLQASASQQIKQNAQHQTQEEVQARKELKKMSSAKNAFLKPLLTAGLVFGFIMLIGYHQFVFAQVRQYISPASQVSTPAIVDPDSNVCEGKQNGIIIPKVNVDVPVVYDEKSFDEAAIQTALERGVVHYGTTSLPGQTGNNVIVGHSSGNFFNSGKYKYAFVLLDHLEEGDTFNLCYENERYIYKINTKIVVDPTNLDYVQQYDPETGEDYASPTTTLITCSPPGTSWRRLILQGEQISPNASTAKTPSEEGSPIEVDSVPGDSPSFWDRIF